MCSGNRVRSPLAEALLARRTVGLPVRVCSFGTLDLGPQAPPPDAIAVGAALGVDLTGHRARVLRPESLREEDLVIGFEPFHVASAVVEGGADRTRSFTIRELDGLLAELELGARGARDEARELVAAANAIRVDGGPRLSALSLGDPYGRPRRAYEQAAAQIDDLVARLAGHLFAADTMSQAV